MFLIEWTPQGIDIQLQPSQTLILIMLVEYAEVAVWHRSNLDSKYVNKI